MIWALATGQKKAGCFSTRLLKIQNSQIISEAFIMELVLVQVQQQQY
jgi:hypothetical protein